MDKNGLPGGSVVKNSPAMEDKGVQSLGQEDPLEKEMAIHSSILAWTIPWAEEPGGLQSMGSQKVGCSRVTEHSPAQHTESLSHKNNFLSSCILSTPLAHLSHVFYLCPGLTPASGPCYLLTSSCSSPSNCLVPTCMGWENTCTSSTGMT